MLVPRPGCRAAAATKRSTQIELTAARLWEDVCDRLRGALNETTFQTWFVEADGVELDEDAFAIGVPNDFTREWIEGHFLGLIAAAVKDSIGGERQIRLLVVDAQPVAVAEVTTLAPDGGVSVTPAPKAEQASLSTKYTFDSFVIG